MRGTPRGFAPRRGAGFFVQRARNGALRLNQSCHNPTDRALARTVERTVRLDRAVAEVIPDRPRVARVVDELAAAAVPQHVGVDLPLETGFGADPLEQLQTITSRRDGSKKQD